MKLQSQVFKHNGKIPSLYTCQGKNINPPLDILDVPTEAKSLALIMDDPDVPEYIRKDGLYVHWILFDLDPKTQRIEEECAPSFGTLGKNTSGKSCYTGPCPPDREHRYFFKLYALDTWLLLPAGIEKRQLLQAMEGHILAECELMGRFEKS